MPRQTTRRGRSSVRSRRRRGGDADRRPGGRGDAAVEERLVDAAVKDAPPQAATFSVELRDGTVAPVALESPYYASSVFVMLGDGVHQYLGGASGLRSAPHSVEMVDGLDRSWYGVMVLPPLDAAFAQDGIVLHLVDDERLDLLEPPVVEHAVPAWVLR